MEPRPHGGTMERQGRPLPVADDPVLIGVVVASEGPAALRRAQSGRSVPAGAGVAPLAGGTGAVAAAGDVVQGREVGVRDRVRGSGGVPGQRIDGGDDRGGLAGATDLRPGGGGPAGRPV